MLRKLRPPSAALAGWPLRRKYLRIAGMYYIRHDFRRFPEDVETTPEKYLYVLFHSEQQPAN